MLPTTLFQSRHLYSICGLSTESQIPFAIDIQIPQQHCPFTSFNLDEEQRAGCVNINLDECGAGMARSPGSSSHQIKMKSIEEEKMQTKGVASCSKASTNKLNNNPSKDNKRGGTKSAKALNAATGKVLKEGASQADNKSNNSDISSISTSSSFTSNDIKITDSKVEVVFEVPNQKLGDIVATDSSCSSNTHSRDSSSNEPSSHSASSNNSENSSHDSSDGYYTQDLDSYFKDVVEMHKSFRFLS